MQECKEMAHVSLGHLFAWNQEKNACRNKYVLLSHPPNVTDIWVDWVCVAPSEITLFKLWSHSFSLLLFSFVMKREEQRVGWKTTLWCEGQICQLRKLSAKWFLNTTSAALATPGQDCYSSSTLWMYNLQQWILNKPHNYYKVPETIIGLCSDLLVSYISTVPAFHISVILYSSVFFTVVVLWFMKQQA